MKYSWHSLTCLPTKYSFKEYIYILQKVAKMQNKKSNNRYAFDTLRYFRNVYCPKLNNLSLPIHCKVCKILKQGMWIKFNPDLFSYLETKSVRPAHVFFSKPGSSFLSTLACIFFLYSQFCPLTHWYPEENCKILWKIKQWKTQYNKEDAFTKKSYAFIILLVIYTTAPQGALAAGLLLGAFQVVDYYL